MLIKFDGKIKHVLNNEHTIKTTAMILSYQALDIISEESYHTILS